MARTRTPLEAAAGKLVSGIQKEWGEEVGEPSSPVSEEVMHTSHSLLQSAAAHGSLSPVLGSASIVEFLGAEWVRAHPRVLPYIQALEAASRVADV